MHRSYRNSRSSGCAMSRESKARTRFDCNRRSLLRIESAARICHNVPVSLNPSPRPCHGTIISLAKRTVELQRRPAARMPSQVTVFAGAFHLAFTTAAALRPCRTGAPISITNRRRCPRVRRQRRAKMIRATTFGTGDPKVAHGPIMAGPVQQNFACITMSNSLLIGCLTILPGRGHRPGDGATWHLT